MKRIISIMTVMAMLMSLIVLPQTAYAFGDDIPAEHNDATNFIHDIYTYDSSRADMTYKILGTSSSHTLTKASDLSSSKSYSENKYLWVGVSVSKLSRVEKKTAKYWDTYNDAVATKSMNLLDGGLQSISTGFWYDKTYFEFDDSYTLTEALTATNLLSDLDLSGYVYDELLNVNADLETRATDYEDYYERVTYGPLELTAAKNFDPTDKSTYESVDFNIGEIDATLKLSTASKVVLDSTLDDDEHLLLAIPLKMISDTAPDTTDVVVQAYPTSETSFNPVEADVDVLPEGGIQFSRFTIDPPNEDATDTAGRHAWWFNFDDPALKLSAGPPSVKFVIPDDTPANATFSDGTDTYTVEAIDNSGTYEMAAAKFGDAENDIAIGDTDYSFDGWYSAYTAGAGAGDPPTFDKTKKVTPALISPVTGSEIYYARFTKPYTLTVTSEWDGSAGNSWFDDSGSKVATNDYTIDQDYDNKYYLTKTQYDAIKADVKVATGYEIEGIYTDSGFTKKIDESTLADDTSVTGKEPLEIDGTNVKELFVKTKRATLDVTFHWDATNTDTVTLEASETDGKFYLTNTTSNLLTTEQGKFTLDSDKNFSGWYYESAFTNAASENDVVTSSKKDLYAKITDKVYKKVTFDSNGGDPTTAQEVQVEEGKALSTGLAATEQIAFTATDTLDTGKTTWKVKAPTRTGYTFAGWYKDPDSTTESALADATGTISDDTTYKAKWTRNEINVTLTAFDFNTDNTDSTSWFLDTTSTPVGTTPFKIEESTTTAGEYKIASVSDLDALLKLKDKSYEIEGWYTDSGFTAGNKISDGYTIPDPSNPPTLYANVQQIKKTVTFSVAKPSNAASGDTSYDNLKFTDTNAVTTTAELTADPTDGKVYLTQAAMDAAEALITGYPNSHEFGGWYSDETRSTSATTSLEIGSSTVIYAKTGEKTQITITFESDAGTTYASVMVHQGNSFTDEGKKVKWTSPSEASPTVGNPTKSGYSFDGWYLDPTDTSTGAFTEATTFSAAATYIAKWNEDTKDATFHADAHSNFSGTASDTKVYKIWADATPKYTVTYTTAATTPAGATAATKSNIGIAEDDITVDTGYEIEGWYKDSGFTQKIDADYDITADTDVYVKTQRIEYDVTFALGGATTGVQYDTDSTPDGTGDATTYTKTLQADTTTGKVTVDATADLADAESRITGIPNKYEFGGWYTDATCTTPYTAGDITGDTTLYANIKEKTKYDVKFEASEATTTYTTVTISVHDGLTLLQEDSSNTVEKTNTDTSITTFKVPNPVRTNYRFVGWYEDPSDTTTGEYTEATTFTAAKTYKAAWVEDTVDVTFKDTKASPQADIVYTVNANKKLSDSDAGAIVKDDGSGILKVGGTAVATGAAVADVPDDPDAAANYMFYGWYTLKSGVNLSDITAVTTKTAMDQKVTDGDIVEFDDSVDVGTTAFNVYALYVLSDNAKLKPNDDDGDPNGAVFKEFDNTGADIPFVSSDYKPVNNPAHKIAALTAADETVPTFAPTGTAASFDPDKTYDSTAATPDEFYMVVENEVNEAYTELTTVNPGSDLKIEKWDTSLATPAWVEITQSPARDTTTGTSKATLPLDVTENKSANQFLVTITAPDGTTEAQYMFNILRFAIPEIKMGYGNTPYGLIMRDPVWTDAEKATAKTKFDSQKVNKKYDKNYIPIIGYKSDGVTPIYAQNDKAYSKNAWKSYSNYNYDTDDYAYVVYQGSKFVDAGYTVYNEYAETVTTDQADVVNFTVQRQIKSGAPVYGTSVTGYADYKSSDSGVYDASTKKYKLTGKMIKPDVYDMNYEYDLNSVYGNTEHVANKRALIVIDYLGDLSLTTTPATNATDSKYLSNNASKVNKGNSLYAFRIADLSLTTTPAVNATDSKNLSNNASTINKAKFRYYPELN